jgi:hypothetical protein
VRDRVRVIPGLIDPEREMVLAVGLVEVLGPWPEGVAVYARQFYDVPWSVAFHEDGSFSDTGATQHVRESHP